MSGAEASLAISVFLACAVEAVEAFAVGVLLTSFGVFWGAEGAGVTWPGALAALVVLISLASWSMVHEVRNARRDLVEARG